MLLFLLSGLGIIVVFFLIMLAAQLIRIEKKISHLADVAEIHVKRIYGQK